MRSVGEAMPYLSYDTKRSGLGATVHYELPPDLQAQSLGVVQL